MFNVFVAVIGGLVVVLGLVSKKLERMPVPATLLAFLAGIALGPAGLDVADVAELADRSLIVEKVARLTLAIGLMSVALRIPKAFVRSHWRGMSVLVALGMVCMWAISTGLVYAFLPVPLELAALIGAIVTPTDPVAATPIVTGPVAERNLPARLRHTLSFESGANDGLSYLFVFAPLLLLTRPAPEAVSYWLTQVLLWEVGLATAVGLGLGYVAARLLVAAERRDFIIDDWRLVYTAALALLAVGAGRLIHSDEVLLVFVAGVAFTQVVDADDRKSEEHGQEAMNRFFSIPFFTLLGIVVPWNGWAALGWQGVALAALLLLLRRPPVLLLLRPLIPSLRHRSDALLAGWFGPIAVAALYYAALVEHRIGEALVWDVTTLVVAMSVVVHGVTAVPFTRWYGRAAEDEVEDEVARGGMEPGRRKM